MEHTTTPSTTVASQGAGSSESTAQPPKSKRGCLIAGAIGCFLLIILALGAAGVAYYLYKQYQEDTANYDWNINTAGPTVELDNTNTTNTTADDVVTDDISAADVSDEITVTESGELVDESGVSLGFEADPISPDLYAYQIGAYSSQHFSDTDWPALRVTMAYPQVPPMTDVDDVGSLWVGAVLDNNYFIQVGMMSSTEADADGNMQWNYFWQMWDDHDNYKYGLQEPMENYDWHNNGTNTFTMTCQNPETGDWEFWVNDEVVGTTNTKSCALDVYNSQLFWELTTDKTIKEDLPTFGPFTLEQLEYWDSYAWQPVQSATLSYGFGQVIDGTESDQASVCPPYGASTGPGQRAFQAGSTLSCLENDATLWD